jgi:probable HAF family extracellular repeat protein
MRRFIGFIVSSLIVAFGPSALQAQTGPGKFTYVAIPTLPGGTFTSLGGINQRNQVVGYGDVSDGSTHGFIYDVGRKSMRDIGEGQPLAINDFGLAVGSNAAGGAALFWGGEPLSLETLPDELFSEATSINNVGVAVGIAELPGRAFKLVGYLFGLAVPIDLGSNAQIYVALNPVINDSFIVSCERRSKNVARVGRKT